MWVVLLFLSSGMHIITFLCVGSNAVLPVAYATTQWSVLILNPIDHALFDFRVTGP